MMQITLKGMEFYAYHGYYQEERKVGNRYSVDVSVWADKTLPAKDSLSETLNYEGIYAIVREEMITEARLLETLSAKIAHKLLRHYEQAQKVAVEVKKFNPPVGGNCQYASVALQMDRSRYKQQLNKVN